MLYMPDSCASQKLLPWNEGKGVQKLGAFFSIKVQHRMFLFLLPLLLVQTTAFGFLARQQQPRIVQTLSHSCFRPWEPLTRRTTVPLAVASQSPSVDASSDDNNDAVDATTRRSCRLPPPRRVGWLERCRELLAYKKEYGDCLVPKRYKANPGLANWVSKQRSEYKRHQNQGSNSTLSSSLNASRIQILNDLGFCWDARGHASRRWWDRLETVRAYRRAHPDIPLALVTYQSGGGPTGAWLDRQRHAVLGDEQHAALDALDRTWRLTQQEYRWEVRFQELQTYRKQHGDCCVPISYAANPVLAHWVSTQRKQYNLRLKGKWTNLTQDRIKRLNSIGFAWNRWEYEFSKMVNMAE